MILLGLRPLPPKQCAGCCPPPLNPPSSSRAFRVFSSYYERTFDSDDKYAVQTSGENVFCSVEKMFITPNINKTNLFNEYKTY